MNWWRALYTAGAGVAALCIVFSTVFVVLVVTFDLAAAFSFGGSSSGGQLIWVLFPPAAVSISSALLALALGAGRRRRFMCAGVAFVTAIYVSFREIVPYNPLLDHEARFIIFMFSLISVLSILIATLRRNDISRPRAWSIVALVIGVVVVSFAGIIVFPLMSVGTSVLTMGGFAWIILPALTALFIPPSGETQALRKTTETNEPHGELREGNDCH